MTYESVLDCDMHGGWMTVDRVPTGTTGRWRIQTPTLVDKLGPILESYLYGYRVYERVMYRFKTTTLAVWVGRHNQTPPMDLLAWLATDEMPPDAA